MHINVPAGVTVNVAEGNFVTVKGPKGTLTKQLNHEMTITQEGAVITVTRPSDDKEPDRKSTRLNSSHSRIE